MHRTHAPERSSDLPEARAPSAGLLTAALAGLMVVAAGGCEDESNDASWADEPAPDASTLSPAPVAQVDAGGLDAGSAPPSVGAAADAGASAPLITKEVEGLRTLASLRSECDGLGGYMQVHAACAGANSCRGFSYNAGAPGTYTEHTCASANGCGGASCVVLPADTGKTGKQIYELEDLPAGGPATCLNCHAIWHTKDAQGNELPPDASKFKLWLMPGSTRNDKNWLELSAEAQEQIVAFGKTGQLPDGTAQVSMKPYHKLFSRAEIQRVVQHIRTLTPVVAEIKAPE